ncbi:unnamed protein product, partial [Heterosigma akashiwo]
MVNSSIPIAEEIIPEFSFRAPFDQHDVKGNRRVPGFKVGGDANVLQNFLRLTHDGQINQRGFLESTKVLGLDQLSLSFKYRISGEGLIGESGDFLGLWITSSQGALGKGGPVFGMPENIVGVGVVLETGRIGVDRRSTVGRKNVRLLVMDGTDGVGLVNDAIGCQSTFRYQEDRGDFGVHLSSRLRLRVEAVDSRASGHWRTCVRAPLHSLPQGWLADSRLGLVGATSARTNNQDALALRVFGTASGAFARAEALSMEEEVEEVDLLVHRLEHELQGVEAKLAAALRALEDREGAAEARLAALEARLEGKVAAELDARVVRLERDVGDFFSNAMVARLQRLEARFEDRVDGALAEARGHANAAWRLPFLAL